MRGCFLIFVVATVAGLSLPAWAEDSTKPSGDDVLSKSEIGNGSDTPPVQFPSARTILQALPEGQARPKRARIHRELMHHKVSDARFYPMVGQARLAQVRFKCTIISDAGTDIVYLDESHLIAVK